MSTNSSKTDQDSSKSSKSERNKSKNLNPESSAPEIQNGAGTSNLDTNETQKQESSESWAGYFPPNMWFWKPVETPQEVVLKSWSMTSILSDKNENEPKSQVQVRKTESHYLWPNTVHIKEPQRLANQPTLDQLIEQRKLRDNQILFTEDFNKHVDYLGERISSNKLNILFAQLNNLLPTTSEELIDATRTLTKSKPLQVKKSISQQLKRKNSKASEILSPEETAQREQQRQNQLEEYENLRGQIGLFGETSSASDSPKSNTSLNMNRPTANDETISKTDLQKLVETINKMPKKISKENMKTLKNLILEKPTILKILQEVHKRSLERLTPEAINQAELRKKEMEELDEMRDQIALYEESSLLNMTKITPEINDRSFIDETISDTRLQKLVTQLNKPMPQPESFHAKQSKASKTTIQQESKSKLSQGNTSKETPEEIMKRQELRQKQIQEYETLREQIGLFGERKSDTTLHDRKESYLEERISKTELKSFISQLNAVPFAVKKIQDLPANKNN